MIDEYMLRLLKNAPDYMEITVEEYENMPIEIKKDYNFALMHIKDENASGPFGGGWYESQRALIRIGWKEKIVECGCRSYTSVYREKRLPWCD